MIVDFDLKPAASHLANGIKWCGLQTLPFYLAREKGAFNYPKTDCTISIVSLKVFIQLLNRWK